MPTTVRRSGWGRALIAVAALLCMRCDTSGPTTDTRELRVYQGGRSHLMSEGQMRELSGYDVIAETLTLSGPNLPKDMSALRGVKQMAGILFWETGPLQSLHGLEALSELTGGRFEISDAPALEDISALSNLHTLGSSAYLSVVGTSRLESLAGLQNVGHVGWHIELEHNERLRDISALRGLDMAGAKTIRIIHNPKLPRAHINEVVASFEHFRGRTIICGNQDDKPCED